MSPTLLLIGLLAASQAEAPATGQLSGRVSDEDTLPIPGVHVIATTESHAPFETSTDPTGRYHFDALPIGVYELRFAQAGFDALRVSDVGVVANQETTLEVGIRTADDGGCCLCRVRVPIDVTSGDRGNTLRQEPLGRLPLGRSYQSAAAAGYGATSDATAWVRCGCW